MENFKPNHLNVYVTVLLIMMVNLKCFSTRSVFSIENNDMFAIFHDLHRDIGARGVRVANNSSYKIYPYSRNQQPIVIPEPIDIEKTSPWPMETQTRKHYELINMLWRKTKISLDTKDFTIFHTQTPSWLPPNLTKNLFRITQNNKQIKKFVTRSRTVTITTPSKIEFYYLNSEDYALPLHNREEKCSFGSKCMNEKIKSQNMGMAKSSDSSFLVFHVRGPSRDVISEAKSVPAKQFYNHVLVKKGARNSYSTFLVTNKSPTPIKHNRLKKKSQIISTVSSVNFFTTNSKRVSFRQSSPKPRNKTQNISTYIMLNKTFKPFDLKTTVYDKIKFFEMYDRMTPVRASKWKPDYRINTKAESKNKLQNEQKIYLINVDQSGHEHNQSKHSKKHIREDQLSNIFSTELPKTEKRIWKNEIVELKNEIIANTSSVQSTSEKINKFEVIYNYLNRTVKWSEYPFAAVYIYEPANIHCDAAAISPHWLIASGACLSRLNKNPYGERRSAFVAYCGVEWWKPERISYVKYSLVHPSFHPSEKPRKYLYNIGLVQVVTSMMSACSGWSPVTMMSHQFATAQEGTVASALGWGLDRFDSKYASMNVPRFPLTLYNALLFSDSCPRNLASSDETSIGRGVLNKNVYCLALPPYFGEDTDPVHGGLLLVGSNLIALYLKEERRSWGEQSAQYTGIWRLIPWITEVAKETDDIDTSFMEI